MRATLLVTIVVALIGTAAAPAHAATTCVFDTRAQTMVLRGDCQTDASIAIADGFTLDGRGHRIVAVDPPGGHYTGAILRNAGTRANVRNVVLEAQALASVCDPSGPPDLRLRGILLDGASGTIAGTRVLGINQGQSGCQEGNAIEARAGEGQASAVLIAFNVVEGYQKTGILVNGNVDATVDRNRVVGLGPVSFIGQNGIQLGFGARGRITRNQVSRNIYTQSDAAGAGILLLQAGDAVEVSHNVVEDCDVGVWLVATSEALIEANRITDSTFDAIAIDGTSGAATGSLVVANRTLSNAVGIALFGEGTTLNTVEDNTALFNNDLDISNSGDNSFAGNRCRTSSGPPVDCP